MPRHNDPPAPKKGPPPAFPRVRPRQPRRSPAPPMATVHDVALRWGHDPSDAESALIELRLADVERMILRKIPDIRLRIAAGDVHFEDVVQVEADAVVRLMRNPEGYISETDGDYSYQIAKELSTGRLAVLDDEWDALGWRKATMSILVPEPQVDGEWDDDFDGDAGSGQAGSGILLVLTEADLPADGDAKLACTTDSATLWIKNPAAATANANGWVQVGAASKLPTGQQRGQLMSWNDVSQGWEPAKWTFTALAGATLMWSGTRQAWVASENRLQDSTDVDAVFRAGGGALATGDVLSYDAASQRWVVKAPSDFLSQMVITAAATGDVLTWNGTNWVNTSAYTKAQIDGKLSGLASGLARKPAVQDILTVPPIAPTQGPNYIIGKSATGDWAGHDNEVVFWSGTAWVFSAATKGDTHTVLSTNTSMTWNGTGWVSVGSQASKLGELSDVKLGAVPAKNDAVMWDGSKWINQPVPKPKASPVSDHKDVDTTGVKDKDHLAFVAKDGMWKPTPALDHTLDGLKDTALPTVLNAGDVVVWDAVAQKWTAKAPSGLSVALDGLLDVTAGAPADGDILRWDALAGQWINRVLSSDLAGLSDVDVSVLNDGDALTWDGAKWVSGALRLEDDLNDVSLQTPQNRDFLIFNGAEWENRPVLLGDLSDLELTGGTDGEVLTFDTAISQWVNRALPGYTQTEVDRKLGNLVLGLEHRESVISITATPPSAPVENDLVIVGTGATGVFSGHENSLALWYGGNWVFTPPVAKETHLVEDEGSLFHWNGTTWVKVATTTGAAALAELTDVRKPITPSAGQVLAYNSDSKWAPVNVAPYPKMLGYVTSRNDLSAGKALSYRLTAKAGHTYRMSCSISAIYDNESDQFAGSIHETIGQGNETVLVSGQSVTMGGLYHSTFYIQALSTPGVDGPVEYSMFLDNFSSGVVINRSFLTVEDLGPDGSAATALPDSPQISGPKVTSYMQQAVPQTVLPVDCTDFFEVSGVIWANQNYGVMPVIFFADGTTPYMGTGTPGGGTSNNGWSALRHNLSIVTSGSGVVLGDAWFTGYQGRVNHNVAGYGSMANTPTFINLKGYAFPSGWNIEWEGSCEHTGTAVGTFRGGGTFAKASSRISSVGFHTFYLQTNNDLPADYRLEGRSK